MKLNIINTQSKSIQEVALFNVLGQKMDVTIDFDTLLNGQFSIKEQGVFVIQINDKSYIIVNLN